MYKGTYFIECYIKKLTENQMKMNISYLILLTLISICWTVLSDWFHFIDSTENMFYLCVEWNVLAKPYFTVLVK